MGVTYDKLLEEELLHQHTDDDVPGLDSRVTNLEQRYEYYEIFQSTSSGTGQVTTPTNASIILDFYPEGVDALVVKLDTQGRPIDEPVYTTLGVLVTTTFDDKGNYVLSGVPAAYPVGIVYFIKIQAQYSGNVPQANIVQAYSVDNEHISNKDTSTSLGTSDIKYPSQNAVKSYIDTGLSNKQDILVSGSNIKTINGSSILGNGNITMTNTLLTGLGANQTVIGGENASGSLILSSTANATKGIIQMGTSAYDELNNRLGLGTTTPSYNLSFGAADSIIGLESSGAGLAGKSLTIQAGSSGSGTAIAGGDLILQSGQNRTSGANFIYLKTYDNTGALQTRAAIDINGCMFIGTTAYTNVGSNRLRIGNKSAVTIASKSTGIDGVIISTTGSGTNTPSLLLEATQASGSLGGATLGLMANDGAAIGDGNCLGTIFFGGQINGTDGTVASDISSFAIGNWSGSATGSRLVFRTTLASSTTKPEVMIMIGGKLSLSNGSLAASNSPLYTLSINGNAAADIGLQRHTTSNTAGNNLTIYGGSCTASATNKDGGMIVISPGLSTNTGKTSVRLQRLTRSASSGTTDNTRIDAIIVPSELNLVNNTATSLFEIALPTLKSCGGVIHYSVLVSDGTDMQVHTGHVQYAIANKGGVYTKQITDESVSDDANANTSGTLAETWSILDGTDKVTIQVNFNSSLTPILMKLYYTIHNGSTQIITQL